MVSKKNDVSSESRYKPITGQRRHQQGMLTSKKKKKKMQTNKNLLVQQFIKKYYRKVCNYSITLKKKLMILLRGAKCNFIEKKLLKLILIYNNIKYKI